MNKLEFLLLLLSTIAGSGSVDCKSFSGFVLSDYFDDLAYPDVQGSVAQDGQDTQETQVAWDRLYLDKRSDNGEDLDEFETDEILWPHDPIQ